MGCSRSFGSFSGLRKHLNKCHVCNSFDSAEDSSQHQSTIDTCNATNIEVSTENVSLNMVKGGCEIAMAMQVPSSTQVLKVHWAKYHGYVYRPHLVICGKIESEIPQFF